MLSIIRQALASLLLTKYRTTNLATLTKINKSEKSLIIINVCIHRRTVCKTGSYAKYVILLKYRDYYYYYKLTANGQSTEAMQCVFKSLLKSIYICNLKTDSHAELRHVLQFPASPPPFLGTAENSYLVHFTKSMYLKA